MAYETVYDSTYTYTYQYKCTMKNKNYHTVRTILKSNIKIVERGKNHNRNT